MTVPEAAVTVLCSPDDGCDGHPKRVESDFAVNEYLHTVASCWILLISVLEVCKIIDPVGCSLQARVPTLATPMSPNISF